MYILSIDQGTTGTTATLIDSKSLKLIDKVNKEFRQILPKPGLVEHDLNDIWKSVELTVSEVIKKNGVDAKSIQAIGITNQRETTCCFDSKGSPLHNAIVWQDRRTEPFCSELRKSKNAEQIKLKTGLPIDPYFSGSKMNWILNSFKNSGRNYSDIHFGTIDTFLLFKLSSGDSFSTDSSNASRTMLMNLDSLNWDHELLDVFGIDKKMLPEIKDSFSEFGRTRGLSFLPDGIPISGILGDQQAALFGQTCFQAGEMKCTYGTGAFILLNTGDKKTYSKNGLLTTVAFSHDGKATYALEGSCYIAGAAVQWLRDNLQIIKSASDIEAIANQVTDLDEMKNIIFYPFFTGLGSPYWLSDATASIIGLTRDTKTSHLSRACLEGIAQSISDIINAFKTDFPHLKEEIRVDGGAVVNNLLMQMQSNFSKIKIQRPNVIETTSYGAGLAAAIGAKLKTFEDLKNLFSIEKEFNLDKSSMPYYENKRMLWKKTLQKLYII